MKLLLLHLVDCLYYCINDPRSHKHQIDILYPTRGSTHALQVHATAMTPLLTVQNYWIRHNVHIRFREKSVKRFENVYGISIAFTYMHPEV